MARLPRLEVVSWPHLLFQRVHDGHMLFRDRCDLESLKKILLESARANGVSVHAYGIGSDHFCLLLTPERPDALSLFMQAVGRRYVAEFNRRHARRGGLWAGRYRATVIEPDPYLLDAMAWVETHGWRVGAVDSAEDVFASSAAHHIGLCSDPLIVDHALFWALGNTPFERQEAWRYRLNEELPLHVVHDFEDAVHKGWALVSQETLPALERLAGRRLVPKPRGRPRKSPQSGVI